MDPEVKPLYNFGNKALVLEFLMLPQGQESPSFITTTTGHSKDRKPP